MAWESYNLYDINGICNNPNVFIYSYEGAYGYSTTSLPSELTWNELSLPNDGYIMGDSTLGIYCKLQDSTYHIKKSINGVLSGDLYLPNNNHYTMYVGVDESQQYGAIFFLSYNNTFYNTATAGSSPFAMGEFDGASFMQETYNFIKQFQPIPQYTWQSVPSISGKNGILNLAQIKAESINDGEPVDNASTLDFDTLGNVNIPAIIDSQMPIDPSNVTSVTATYLIPALESGTYSAIKLLVKKGTVPKTEQDADRVISLDEPTSILRIDSKSVGNLDENSHYYFVAKVVDELGTEATSEPKDCMTGIRKGVIKTTIQIGGGIIEKGIKETITIEKI